MKNLKKSHWVLIAFSILILSGCIGMTAVLLLSNYQNVRLFKQAQNNFLRGDNGSLSKAEIQLQQVIRTDKDNEAAYIMLGEIAGRRGFYSEQVYYCYMAHRLNPLSEKNKEEYIKSLWYARYFERLENFLIQQSSLSERHNQILLYSAGRNGNFNKYKKQLKQHTGSNSAGLLAALLFEYKHLSNAQKISALDNFKDDSFLKQEILAAKTELFLDAGDIGNAEKALVEAYNLNPYAFAPALGRFYANFSSLGKALPIFEKYLESYHDPAAALQTAEIYCLLHKSAELAKLRSQYQDDSGKRAMLLCYYFDALNAFLKNDAAELKELLIPLRKNIKTSLALYMFICVDIHERNIPEMMENYTLLSSRTGYANLQSRADDTISNFLKSSLKDFRGKEEQLMPMANLLYRRKKDAFTAKFILLTQKKSGTLNAALLKDALHCFPKDQGLVKIAIEYNMNSDLAECERYIAHYKRNFAKKSGDMLRYEIALALKKKDFDAASKLFRNNFSQELRGSYWNFASETMREDDLLFLSRDPQYAPFCQAQLLIKKGNRDDACDLLEKTDAKGNLELLFFAAKTLAENNRNQAALNKYAQFPENSAYQLDVLLNTAELFAENGNIERALQLSAKAYEMSPDMPETQLCYADKLFRSGNTIRIPDVIKLKTSTPHRKRMKSLWISGMHQRINTSDIRNSREKTRELCRQLLAIVPNDNIAIECLRKLNKMPQ